MEFSNEQTLLQAVAAHKKRDLKEAERLYRALLQSEPLHPDANHNLGLIAVAVNNVDAALPFFKIALEANPEAEQFWLSYIDALIKEQQFENATILLERGKKRGLTGEKIDALEEALKRHTQSGSKKASDDLFNEKFNAYNVVEFGFDAKILEGFTKILSSPLDRDDFFVNSPEWSSDIQWECSNSFKSYKTFYDVFEKLMTYNSMQLVRGYIDHKQKIIMYSGYFVIRSECTAANFHIDWLPESGTNAWTLITPIIHPPDGANLLYRDNEGLERTYEYKIGRSIAFSSNFWHSTAVGASSSPSILLSLTFGTDLMEYWGGIAKIADYAGQMYRLPNGYFVNKSFD